MKRTDQAGVTLVELLIAIAILGIILVPILALITDSSTRTAIQGKESQLIYFAQEIIEEMKAEERPVAQGSGQCSPQAGCRSSLVTGAEAAYEITVDEYLDSGSSRLAEVRVQVTSLNVVTDQVELVTVMKK